MPNLLSEKKRKTSLALKNYALTLLAQREYSYFTLQNKLLKKGFLKEKIVEVLAKLVKKGLLNDMRFAEMYVHSKVEQGFGPLYIKAKLQECGIDERLIKLQISERENDWDDRAIKARNKKFGAKIPEGYAEQTKQANFLKHRGFTNRQIRAILKNFDLFSDIDIE